MQAIRSITIVVLLLTSECCLGQASLAFKDSSGFTYGWLLGKNSAGVQVLTTDGYVMTFDRFGGSLLNSKGLDVRELVYTGSNCESQPYIKYSDIGRDLKGELIQLNPVDKPSNAGQVFARIRWPNNLRTGAMVQSYLDANGDCENYDEPTDLGWLNPVEHVDQRDYGFWICGSAHPQWCGFTFTSTALDRPEVISCSGFESCSQE